MIDASADGSYGALSKAQVRHEARMMRNRVLRHRHDLGMRWDIPEAQLDDLNAVEAVFVGYKT